MLNCCLVSIKKSLKYQNIG